MITTPIREIANELQCELPDDASPADMPDIIEWLIERAKAERNDGLIEIEEKYARLLESLNEHADALHDVSADDIKF